MIYQCSKCGLSKSDGAMGSVLPQCKCDWAPPAQPAPVQEPKMYEDWYDSSSCGHCGMVNGHAPECRHNYKPPAAQRQWVGLDADEKLRLRLAIGYSQLMTAGEYAELVQQATEAKLKEKNSD